MNHENSSSIVEIKKNKTQHTEISIKINTKDGLNSLRKAPVDSSESFSSGESGKSISSFEANNFSSSSNDADNEANSSSCNSNKEQSPVERNSNRQLIYGNVKWTSLFIFNDRNLFNNFLFWWIIANIICLKDDHLAEKLTETPIETIKTAVKTELLKEASSSEKEATVVESETNMETNHLMSSSKSDNTYELCETVQNSPMDKKSYSCESILIANLSIDEDSNKRHLFKSPVAVTSNQKYEDELNSSKNHQGKLDS